MPTAQMKEHPKGQWNYGGHFELDRVKAFPVPWLMFHVVGTIYKEGSEIGKKENPKQN